MQLNIDVDFDEEAVYLLIDDAIRLSARKNSDGELEFKNFDKLDSDTSEQVLKSVAIQLLNIN